MLAGRGAQLVPTPKDGRTRTDGRSRALLGRSSTEGGGRRHFQRPPTRPLPTTFLLWKEEIRNDCWSLQ